MVKFPDYESTGNQTSSGHVVSDNVSFGGIVVATDGTNDVPFTVYRGDSAVDANAVTPKNITIKGDDHYGGIMIRHPIRCDGGIYVSISGGSPNYVVYYSRKAATLHSN